MSDTEYRYDDDCWLPEPGPTHLSRSLIEAIGRGEAVWNGETLYVKLLPHYEARLTLIESYLSALELRA